jgi:hypothetical protein
MGGENIMLRIAICLRVGLMSLGILAGAITARCPCARGAERELPASPWQQDPAQPSRADIPAESAAYERLAIVSRHEALEREEWVTWRVDYRLRHLGPAPLEIDRDSILVRIGGEVSNSRIEAHAAPCTSAMDATGASGLVGVCDVVPSAEELRRCRERLVVQVWPEAEGAEPTAPMSDAGRRPLDPSELPTIVVGPGQVVRVRLRLEHQHPLHGPFEPLLGVRTLEMQLGSAMLTDQIALDRPRPIPVAAAAATWPPPVPAEYLDGEIYLSAPDSLHLAAHVPGQQSYRFPDLRGVKYGTRMRVSFWYLIAPGTEGESQARITQYRDLPNSWKTLHEGEVDIVLPIVGRWAKVEREFRVQDEATALTFDVRILGSAVNVGELWIDDVRMEPADVTTASLAGP